MTSITSTSQSAMNNIPESEKSVQVRTNVWLRGMSPELALLWSIRIGVVMLFVTPLVVTPSTVFPRLRPRV
jgi:hypothetical protein